MMTSKFDIVCFYVYISLLFFIIILFYYSIIFPITGSSAPLELETTCRVFYNEFNLTVIIVLQFIYLLYN